MLVDCERCPGQHLSPPACPSCVVQLLLQSAPGRPPGRGAHPGPIRPAPGGPPDRVHPPAGTPVEVDLVRRADDLGRPLDAREQRAVAVLTAAGLLSGTVEPAGGRPRAGRSRTA